MMWKSCQLTTIGIAIVPFGESDTQYLRGFYCIITKCFIEITHTKQQYSIGVSLFNCPMLLH